jgi:hypothetical protein
VEEQVNYTILSMKISRSDKNIFYTNMEISCPYIDNGNNIKINDAGRIE